MRFHFVWLFIIPLLANSCTTNRKGTITVIPDKNINTVLNTSLYASNVYIGICGRMSFRDREAEYAKFHIAHQIAMNRKCTVDYGYISIQGTMNDDHALYDSNIAYDDSLIDEMLESITVLEEYRFPDFTVLVAEDTGIPGYTNYKIERIAGERPDWVRHLPLIGSYHVGKGTSDRYSEPYKSILVADIEAAQMIAKEKNLFIQGFTYDDLAEGTENHSKLITGNIFLSKAELYGFYILDRWIEPDGTCHSLAIAKKE